MESGGKLDNLDSDLLDLSGEFHEYFKKTRKAFCLPDSERLLLGCVWTTDDLHRRTCLYPEVLAMDILEKKNRQRRSLFVVAGKDSENKIFPALYAYMPSHGGWFFNWMFRFGIHFIYSFKIRNKIQLMLSDEDVQQYDQFNMAIKRYYPNVKIRLCGFHKLYRSDLKSYKAWFGDKEKTTPRKAHFECIRNWM